MKRFAVVLLCGSLGCAPTTALVNGRQVARPTLGYTDGELYAVNHYAAYPAERGPSSGLREYGGRIAGKVCGLDVNYETENHGHYLDLSGFLSRPLASKSVFPVRIEVRDRSDGKAAEREIIGSSGIDFRMSPRSLHGRVGWRQYDLKAAGDELVGTVKIWGRPYPFLLRGIDALWSMPAVDQATIVPIMLSCVQTGIGKRGLPILAVNFVGGSTPESEPLALPSP